MGALDAVAVAFDPASASFAEVQALNARSADLDAREVIAFAAEEAFAGRLALVSSFGAESAVLLHLVAEVNPNLPVIFLDTGRLFAETLEYRTRLTRRLGLRDVRTVGPDPERVLGADPHRALWMTNPDLCCRIRKTEPLARALDGFDAWLTGRKRFQNSLRADLKMFEADGARIKVNPLARWSALDVRTYAERHALPEHPLIAKGYPSIGCVPCTTRVIPGEDQRAGRWRGLDKTECGIHLPMETDGSGI